MANIGNGPDLEVVFLANLIRYSTFFVYSDGPSILVDPPGINKPFKFL